MGATPVGRLGRGVFWVDGCDELIGTPSSYDRSGLCLWGVCHVSPPTFLLAYETTAAALNEFRQLTLVMSELFLSIYRHSTHIMGHHRHKGLLIVPYSLPADVRLVHDSLNLFAFFVSGFAQSRM